MDIFNKYKTLFEGRNKIKNIVKEMDVDEIFNTVNEICDFSSDYITNLWKSGRKVCRTEYVMKSMRGNYPRRILNTSLAIDAIVNNLDELLDENLPKEKKAIHIIELSKNIGYIQNQDLTDEQRECISTYFKDKIPVIAAGEKYYTSKIENAKENKILRLGKKFYDTRIIDIDIFTELPLIETNANEEYNKILKSSRYFRAVNLIKKDLKDMEKDENNNISTLFTIVKKKNLYPKYYAKKLASEYMKEFNKLLKYNNKIINNFYEMSKREIKKFELF